jgi:DnaJ-class molecular chaperone
MIWRASIRTIRLNSNKIFSDPWTILNVKRDATREEVKNAFIHLARIYHPDNNPSTKSG